MEAKNVEAAIKRLEEGLAVNRADGAMAMMLARIQIDGGQTKAAIDTLSRSLPYDRDRAENHAFMAGLLQKENRHREAIDYYLNALRKVPRNAVWWMGLGISLQAEKRNAEARDAFSRADSIGGMPADLQAFVRQRLEQLR
jgi:MSHA biogenesis protein MshN